MGTKRKLNVTVDIEQDESGAWIAEVRELSSCHTHGRSITQAKERITEAMQLFDELDEADVTYNVKLPAAAKKAVQAAVAIRTKAEKVQAEALKATAAAAEALTRSGVSVRDAAMMLGVSHQRVHQILHER